MVMTDIHTEPICRATLTPLCSRAVPTLVTLQSSPSLDPGLPEPCPGGASVSVSLIAPHKYTALILQLGRLEVIVVDCTDFDVE